MKVLITGGTGFVGGHLVKASLDRGYEVRCLVRHTSDVESLRGLSVELVYGDLTQKDALKAAVANVGVIIHSAALIHSKDTGILREINVVGTKNLLDAVVEDHVPLQRFVHVSSVVVCGPKRSDKPLDETSVCEPTTPHEKAKYEAELVVKEYYEKHKLPTVIARPCRVYGPRDSHDDFIAIIRHVNRGLRFRFPKDAPLSLVYVKNLVDALMLCVDKPKAIGNTYVVTDGPRYKMNEVIDSIAEVVSRHGIPVPFPGPLLKIYSKLTGELRYAVNKVNYSCDKIVADLGYRPPYSLKEGLRETIEWSVQCGLLKPGTRLIGRGQSLD